VSPPSEPLRDRELVQRVHSLGWPFTFVFCPFLFLFYLPKLCGADALFLSSSSFSLANPAILFVLHFCRMVRILLLQFVVSFLVPDRFCPRPCKNRVTTFAVNLGCRQNLDNWTRCHILSAIMIITVREKPPVLSKIRSPVFDRLISFPPSLTFPCCSLLVLCCVLCCYPRCSNQVRPT
jgi:hypothetical protein